MGISEETLRAILPMLEQIVESKYERDIEEGKDWFVMQHFVDFEAFSIIKEYWQKTVPKEKQMEEPHWSKGVGSAYDEDTA